MPAPTPVPRIAPKTNRGPSRRAVNRLGEREAVRVVGETHGTRERALEVGLQVAAVEAGRVAVAHEPGRERARSRRRHPDAAARSQLVFRFAHERRHGRDGALVIAGGRGDAAAQAFMSRRIECRDLDLGAAEVDTDPHRPGASRSFHDRAL